MEPPSEADRRSREFRHAEKQQLIDAISRFLNNLVRYGAFVAVAVFVYLSIKELAGKATLANIGIRLFSDIRITEAVAWAVAAFTGGGWFKSWRQVRKSTEIADQKARLERKIDPNRTSSDLTQYGGTNPEDV